MSTYRVTLPDGALTHVEQWGQSGPALVCVHGITSSRMGWRRFAERFADRYRVFAYDQRGHGDSAATIAPMTLADNVADLAAVVTSVAAPVAALIGHSWGGAVVILGGRTIPVPKIVAIDPVVTAPREFNANYVQPLREDLALAWPARERALRLRFADMDPVDFEGKLHAVRNMRAASLENLERENNAEHGGWELRERVRDYPKPLFIPVPDVADSTLGADDRAFIREHGGPNISMLQFDGAGHSIHRTQLDQLVRALDPFLEAC